LQLNAVDNSPVIYVTEQKQGNHRQQTSPPVPHSDELNETLVVWHQTGATTWRTLSKYNVMSDSGPLAHAMKM